jgi:hypothetical protein
MLSILRVLPGHFLYAESLLAILPRLRLFALHPMTPGALKGLKD